MIKVMSIFGTRPEAIKLAPVIHCLVQNPKFESIVCVTGQHREMLDQVLTLFDIKVNYDLNIMKSNQTLAFMSSEMSMPLQEVISQEKPDWIIVQGDTTTAFIGALIGFYNKVKIAHLEAGLRTNDLTSPFPEEANRQLLSRIVDLHFPPTEGSKRNLLQENISKNKIMTIGNTVIDSLIWVSNKAKYRMEWDNRFGTAASLLKNGGEYILITGHRRENHGLGFEGICSGIKVLAEKYSNINFIYPVHLNPIVKKITRNMLSDISNVHLIEPLSYELFIYLLKNCKIVLTDSGGIQEEAPSLGKPVLIMRDTSERPEGIEAGTAKLIGTDEKSIVESVSLLLDNELEYNKMAKAINPYGDGLSSERVVRELEKRTLV